MVVVAILALPVVIVVLPIVVFIIILNLVCGYTVLIVFAFYRLLLFLWTQKRNRKRGKMSARVSKYRQWETRRGKGEMEPRKRGVDIGCEG